MARRVRAARRPTNWLAGFDATSTGIGSFTTTATGKVFMGGFTIADQDAVTLIRTRGELLVNASPSGGGQVLSAAVGIAKVNAYAASIGATAIPGPWTDANWDGWLWHQFVTMVSTAGAATNAEGSMVARYEIDSKAARKWDFTEESLVIIAEVGNNSIGGTTYFRAQSRHLIKQ